jgi:chromosome segregation ATPase
MSTKLPYEPPSEESVRFHEDQIERFERHIERLQDQIVEIRDQIDQHQQWLDEKTRPTWDIALTLTDLQIIRNALAEHMDHPERRHYNRLVQPLFKRIDELHTEGARGFTYTGPSYPEMMKYPGKIKIGDHEFKAND